MAAINNENQQTSNVSVAPEDYRSRSIIIKSLFAFSILSSLLFITLSYFYREVGYYLLTISSFITLIFAITALPRRDKEPNAFFVFLLSASYQLLIILLASVLPSYQGIPYAVIALTLALIISAAIPRSGISDWVVTIGVIGAIASIQLTLLALLPQVDNQAISSVIFIIAVILRSKLAKCSVNAELLLR